MQVLFSLKHETKTTWWQCSVLVLINWYFVNSICSYIMIGCVLCANCFEFEKGKSKFLGLGFCIVSFWLLPLSLERILSDSLVFFLVGFCIVSFWFFPLPLERYSQIDWNFLLVLKVMSELLLMENALCSPWVIS